jgi:hypothetical protein
VDNFSQIKASPQATELALPGRQIEHAHRVNDDSATAVLVCDAGSDSSRAFLAVEFSTVEFASKRFTV